LAATTLVATILLVPVPVPVPVAPFQIPAWFVQRDRCPVIGRAAYLYS
jgi:hypothetical protein